MQVSKPSLPVYFTTEEVAQSLRVNERTVYEWLQSGQMEGVKAGKYWRVSQEAFDRFLEISRGRGGRPRDAAPSSGPVGQADQFGQAAVSEVPAAKPGPAKNNAARRR